MKYYTPNFPKSLNFYDYPNFLTTPLFLLSLFVFQVFAHGQDLNSKECELKLGMILPLTGTASQYGDRARRGAETAISLQAEYMPDCKLKVFYEDSAWETVKGVNAFHFLKAKHNIDVIVSGASHISLAILPLATSSKIPQIAIFSSAEKFSSYKGSSFRLSPRVRNDLEPVHEWLASQPYKKIAVLYIENEFGLGMKDEFKRLMQSRNLLPTAEISYLPTESDFRTILHNLKKDGVEVIFLAGLPSHFTQIIAQAHRIDFRPYFISNRTAEDKAFLAQEDLTGKLLFSSFFDPSAKLALTQQFVAKYNDNHKVEPDSYSAEGFEAVRIIGMLWAKCRGDKKCFKSEFRAPAGIDTIFGTLRFDAQGNTHFPMHLRSVRNGRSFNISN